MEEELQSQDAESLEETSEEESQAPSEDELDALRAENAKLKAIAERKAKQLEKAKQSVVSDKEAEESTLKSEMETLKNEVFYAKNESYKPYEKLITALKKPGQSNDDVIKSEEFKLAYRDDSAPVKSVIHSNDRIANDSSDYQKDFQEALKDERKLMAFLQKHKGFNIPEA